MTELQIVQFTCRIALQQLDFKYRPVSGLVNFTRLIFNDILYWLLAQRFWKHGLEQFISNNLFNGIENCIHLLKISTIVSPIATMAKLSSPFTILMGNKAKKHCNNWLWKKQRLHKYWRNHCILKVLSCMLTQSSWGITHVGW